LPESPIFGKNNPFDTSIIKGIQYLMNAHTPASIKKFVFILALLLIAVSPLSAEEAYFAKDVTEDMDIPDVVARVDDLEINSKYLKFELNRLLRKREKPLSLLKRQRLASDILDREINRELIYIKGVEQGVTTTPEEIGKEYEKLKTSYGSRDEFQKAIQARGLTEAEIKKSIKVDLVANVLLGDQVKGNIQITDEQVQQFFQDKKDNFMRPESFRTQHIFVPHVPMEVMETISREDLMKQMGEYSAKAEKKIQQIYEEVKGGGDFAELARKYSEDAATASNGGDLDFMYKGVFDPAFDEAVSKMKKGEVSGVVKSQFGYHIIKLNETRPAEPVPFEDVKASIQQYLFTTEAQSMIERFIDSLRKKADIKIFYGLNK